MEVQQREGSAIYAISDVHVELPANMVWLRELPDQPRDIILVAGDLGVNLQQLEEALSVFQLKFKHVFYCFGNHECWVNPREGLDSLGKIAAIKDMCDRLGVLTKTTLVDSIWIVPILGWYHESWDTEPPLRPPPGKSLKLEPEEAHIMSTDYQACRWDYQHGSEELAQRLDEENEAWHTWPLPPELLAESAKSRDKRTNSIVSFSHFLPRIELHHEKRFSTQPNLAKLIGSSWIRSRIEELQPDLHVFGHTHLPWNMTLDGVHYVSWPLGTPTEQNNRLCTYPTEVVERWLPLKVMDSRGRHDFKREECCASRVYELIDRDPGSHVWAMRVAGKYCPEAYFLMDDVMQPGRRHPFNIYDRSDEDELRRLTDAYKSGYEQAMRRPMKTQKTIWRVVGGADKGGIIVREGRDTSSTKLTERLSHGAVVEEFALQGERLLYKRLTGTGPREGWVSISLSGKELLVRQPPSTADKLAKAADPQVEVVIAMQRDMIAELRRPENQQSRDELLRQYPGKKRAQQEFLVKKAEWSAKLEARVFPARGFSSWAHFQSVAGNFFHAWIGVEEVKRNHNIITNLIAGDNFPQDDVPESWHDAG